MCVGDFESFNNETDACRTRCRLDRRDQLFCRAHPGAEIRITHLEPIRNFCFREHERHPWLNRMDIQEGEKAFIFPDLVAGDFPGNDATEDVWHRNRGRRWIVFKSVEAMKG